MQARQAIFRHARGSRHQSDDFALLHMAFEPVKRRAGLHGISKFVSCRFIATAVQGFFGASSLLTNRASGIRRCNTFCSVGINNADDNGNISSSAHCRTTNELVKILKSERLVRSFNAGMWIAS